MSETISRPFTFVKDEVFYFSRRIPKELRHHYSSPRIAYSLRMLRLQPSAGVRSDDHPPAVSSLSVLLSEATCNKEGQEPACHLPEGR
ncbi:MAG: DUF6538 domain-containing protein [Roseovarius sp.]